GHDDARLRRRNVDTVGDLAGDAVLVGSNDAAARQVAGAVGQTDSIACGEAAYDRGVPALVAGQDDPLAGAKRLGVGVGEEQRGGHAWPAVMLGRRTGSVEALFEGVADPGEEVSIGLPRHRSRHRLFVAQRRQFAQQLLLAVVELGRRLDVKADDEIAAARTAQLRHAAGAEPDLLAVLRPGPDLDGGRAVERLELHRGSQCRGRHRHRQRAPQVVAVAGEDRVRGDGHLDVEVTGWSPTRTDLALPGQLDAGAAVDTGRDLDGELAPGTHPAVAGALDTRVRVDRPEAMALRARPGGHDLAEERALHLADLTLAPAGGAGGQCGAVGGPAAVADRTGDRGV